MDCETRVIGRPLQLRQAGKSNYVEGYAAVFFNPADLAGTQYRLWENSFERILPGAFNEALKRPDDVRCCFNHDANVLLGRSTAGTLTLKVDNVGLWFSCQLPDDEDGRKVAEKVGRRDVTGCSFSFTAEKSVWREEGDQTYREIEQVILYDVGPVTFPAYSATDVSLAKRSLASHRQTQPRGLAEFERSWKVKRLLSR